jgi:hypothetical protein
MLTPALPVEPIVDLAEGAGRVLDLDGHGRADHEGVAHAAQDVLGVVVAAVGEDLGAGEIAGGGLVDLDDVDAARTQGLGQVG